MTQHVYITGASSAIMQFQKFQQYRHLRIILNSSLYKFLNSNRNNHLIFLNPDIVLVRHDFVVMIYTC